MRGDLKTIGQAFALPHRIAASVTRFYAGEPLLNTATTSSAAGEADGNTWAVAAADCPVVGADRFGGVILDNAQVNASGIVYAQTVRAAMPIPNITRIRGRAETVASIDTDAELILLLGDYTLFDYNATGSVTGGPLYTIKQTASADTSGLEIVDGNISKGTLDVTVDFRAIRYDVAT